MKYLGRIRVQRNRKSILSFVPAVGKSNAFGSDDIGHSESQARFLLLALASIIHAMYFIMMASKSGFPVMFLAYILSAFSRALLTGM